MRKKLLLCASLAVAAQSSPAAADDFDTVRQALDVGDYGSAYESLAAMGDAGDTLAMLLMAHLQLSHQRSADFGVAMAWLEEAAQNGNVHAMLRLGSLYESFGLVLFPRRQAAPMTAVGLPEAIEWYARAADAGSVEALYRLGDLHWQGTYSQFDPSLSLEDELRLAQEYLERAAAAGSAEATGLLAVMLRPDDPDRYVELLLQAGHMADMRTLGTLAVKPEEARITDPVEALAWKIAARTAWALDPDPRSPIRLMLAAESGAHFDAAMAHEIEAAPVEQRAAAEARAAEIAAGWTSLLPGHSEPEQQ